MGAASAVKTAPRIPLLLTWCRWCQCSHYDCFHMFILQKHLCLHSISSVALYSHVLLHQTCLLLYSTLQLRDTKLPKTTPGKKQQLSVTFIPLFFLRLPSLPPPHVTFSCCLLFHPLSSLPHIIISSHSRRKMISSLPMPLRLNSRVCDRISQWKLPAGWWMWQRRFLLVSTWAGYLRCYVTVGNWLFSECTMRENNSYSSGSLWSVLMNFKWAQPVWKTYSSGGLKGLPVLLQYRGNWPQVFCRATQPIKKLVT